MAVLLPFLEGCFVWNHKEPFSVVIRDFKRVELEEMTLENNRKNPGIYNVFIQYK